MKESIFSLILKGEMPGVIVFEDEVCAVLMDAFPMLPGHVLVIPKEQIVHLKELDKTIAEHLFKVAVSMTKALEHSGFSGGDCNVLVNDGKASGQTVPHVHIHVVPRKRGDAFPFPALFSNGFKKLFRQPTNIEQLQTQADKIKKALD